MRNLDTTRRTLLVARRSPQWQRLIDSIHAAQAAKGYEGRQFGAAEMRAFGATLVGMPVEHVGRESERTLAERRAAFDAYWVERQEMNHSDGSVSVRYALKAVYGDDLAIVHTIASTSDEWDDRCVNPTPEWDEEKAREYVSRANWQVGR